MERGCYSKIPAGMRDAETLPGEQPGPMAMLVPPLCAQKAPRAPGHRAPAGWEAARPLLWVLPSHILWSFAFVLWSFAFVLWRISTALCVQTCLLTARKGLPRKLFLTAQMGLNL